MCGGVEYRSFNKKTGRIETRRTYFPIPNALLPVVGAKGAGLVTWGRRKGEFDETGLPPGGWARIDSLEGGRWNRFHPRPVIIPVSQFMEKDKEGKTHWFSLKEDQVLRGIGVVVDGKPFVYVVTRDSSLENVHARMPVVLTLDEAKEIGDFTWQQDWPWLKEQA
jgi:putative SOS response-associated peptidase YedK